MQGASFLRLVATSMRIDAETNPDANLYSALATWLDETAAYIDNHPGEPAFTATHAFNVAHAYLEERAP